MLLMVNGTIDPSWLIGEAMRAAPSWPSVAEAADGTSRPSRVSSDGRNRGGSEGRRDFRAFFRDPKRLLTKLKNMNGLLQKIVTDERLPPAGPPSSRVWPFHTASDPTTKLNG